MSEITREALLTFARKVVEAGFNGDVDGGDVQDWALDAGLLIPTEMTQACGENCTCAEWGDFPQTCYRFAPELLTVRGTGPGASA